MSRLHTPGTLQGIWLAVFLMLPMQLRAEGEFEAVAGWWKDLWRTPDQQAQRLFDAGDYAAAASLFTDPMRIGMSWFRAGEFKRAAAAFGQHTSVEGYFNRANALLFQGEYEQAIAVYDQVLEQRPGWQAAVDNRAIALARLEKLAPPEDDAGGTGGMLSADEIVFDNTGRVKNAKGEQTTEGVTGVSDAAMREMWLRRVETKPADFLRARFATQLQLQQVDAK
jgi:Ca-activated chloride channel family protein